MGTENMDSAPQPESVEFNTHLSEAFILLNTDAIKRQQMMCNRVGDMLSFYTLYASEDEAQRAHDQLVSLGLNPRVEERKVFLTARFPEDDIDSLAGQFNSIPKAE